MLTRPAALAFALLLAFPVAAQPPRPGVGAPAPEPVFDRRLDGRPAPTLASLRGRAVVVEFWATWCVPCIQAMPRHNELIEAFAGRPLTFLAVTDEDSATVAGFLARRPYAAEMLIDDDRSAYRAYAVAALPTTALVYPDGRFAGFVPARALDRTVLDALLAGRPVSMVPPDTARRTFRLDF